MRKMKVTVRMYRVGELGDCFLLKFKDGQESSSVLIDCGSFRNGEKSVTRMRAIAQHIADEQDSKPLNAVVGTHQHNDHLSGFKHAQDIFLKLRAENGWLSWLDDPKDESAQKIAKGEKKLTKTLENIKDALEKSKNKEFTSNKATDRIADVLGFYLGANGGPPAVPAEGLEVLKKMSNKIEYLQPGDQLDLPGITSGKVKVYVLGPPRNTELLFDIHAGKGASYDPKLNLVQDQAKSFLQALSNFDKTRLPDPDEEYFPFGKGYQKSVDDKNFQNSSYNDKKNQWQKIDTNWLEQAERMALYLDSYTNNTSLVLAFELIESGKVLLFVGDAQTGNWLSWKDIKWENYPENFNTDSLLSRTVFYKVGHHCSHNATLVAGLEMMTHPELVAMIPVDKDDPNIKKKNGWKMPATNLHQRLKEKTQHRLIRMEDTYDEDCNPDVSDSVKKSWAKLSGKVTSTPLFIEYTIDG
jgi:beta-lactamase superfamily II metal-dependent hydrolase